MAIFGRIEDLEHLFTKTQELENLLWEIKEVFKPQSLARIGALSAGETYRIDLKYEMFYMAHCYMLKPESEGFFESHQNYIDIQIVVEGFERYLLGDLSRFSLLQDYDPQKDLKVYIPNAPLHNLFLQSQDCAIFFPEDIHGVGIGYEDEVGKLVRKVIFKVPKTLIKHRL